MGQVRHSCCSWREGAAHGVVSLKSERLIVRTLLAKQLTITSEGNRYGDVTAKKEIFRYGYLITN